MSASIDLIMGPMFSGKTTEIFRRCQLFDEKGYSVLYINSDIDTRSLCAVSTHNPHLALPDIKMLKSKQLYDIFDTATQYDIIAIDECQFFPDLKNFCVDLCETHKKKIIVGGLNGDFKRQLFGQMYELLPYCDTITKLNAYCGLCDSSQYGLFSMRREIANENIVLVGDENIYVPACRNCFLKNRV